MSYLDTAYALARAILTGDSASAKPSDATLALFVASAESDLVLEFPCTGSDGLPTVTGTDLTYFGNALGYQPAAKLNSLPIGQQFLSGVTKVKVGPVERTTGTKGPAQYAGVLCVDARREMLKIGCVRTVVLATRPTNAYYALASRRRLIGEPASVQQEALDSVGGGIVGTDQSSIVEVVPG